MTPIVELRDADLGYGGRAVLRGISLSVQPGEVVAILGANGSGKSTLIRGVLGLVPLIEGSVSLFGTERPGRREWRRVGYVPQRVGAAGGVPATVAEVVSSGTLARRGLLRPARSSDRTSVTDALAAVGLLERAGVPVSTLSGGQQQRALIARAFAAGPELLVLDEPTAGVDFRSQAAFAGALRSFVKDGGTVLLVAHELGPLEELVTRAIVLHRGGIAHDGDVPKPTGEHAHPAHEHVHPHAPDDTTGLWR
jgi:zinc transport system ATP-binding protein